MMQPFVQTLRSLKEDRGRAGAWALAALLLILVAWTAWLFWARITVYEISRKTRLEVAGATYAVHSEVAGKLANSHVQLGQSVRQGDLLFELDSSVEQKRLAGAQARLANLTPRIAVTTKELDSTILAVKAESQTGTSAVKEARARAREARIHTQLAQAEAQRFRQLEGHVAAIDVERALVTAQMREASSDASTLDVQRLLNDQRARLRSGEARAAALRAQLVALQGEQQALLENAAELQQLIEKRQIRAPSSGRIGELLPLHRGYYVAEGAKLATLMPADDLILVAEFEPASALGRIRPQQMAQLRLTGFPWLEFGAVPARVTKVAGEVRDGAIRVEMELLKDARSLIPFQHGLPGTVEVAVERVSPAQLLLRTLGRRLDGASH